MKTIYKYILFSMLILICMLGCEGGLVIDDDSLNTNYYPTQLGSSWIYKMDSIVYDDEGLTVSSSSSFMRERLIEVSSDVEGDSIFVLEISKSQDTVEGWIVSDLWKLEKTNNFLRRTEENLNFVKLVFPPLIGSTWEGNQFDQDEIEVLIAGDLINMYENWDYEVKEKLNKLTINSVEYDDVVTIQQADNENLIKRRYSIEQYARDFGLIYREMIIIDLICSEDCDEELPWEEKGDQGFILKQSLIEYVQ